MAAAKRSRRATTSVEATAASVVVTAAVAPAVRRSPRFLSRAQSSLSTTTSNSTTTHGAATEDASPPPPPAPPAAKRKRTTKRTTSVAVDPASTSITTTTTTTAPPTAVTFKHGTLSRKYEQTKLDSGKYQYVVGCDEAGRGPLAGPVVAAACYVPLDVVIEGVHDSKQLSEPQRELLYEQLTSHPQIKYAVCVTSAQRIDEINILQASLEAMANAVASLDVPADFVFVDGNRMPQQLTVDAETVVQGDSKVYSIAAASVIAKVTRDRIMVELDGVYPQYNLKQHKGYPTREHMAAIATHGACAIHRMTFAPLATKESKQKNKNKNTMNKNKTK